MVPYFLILSSESRRENFREFFPLRQQGAIHLAPPGLID